MSKQEQIEIRPGSKVDDIADRIARNLTQPVLLYNGAAEPWLKIAELPILIHPENFSRMMEFSPFWRNVVTYDIAETLITNNNHRNGFPNPNVTAEG